MITQLRRVPGDPPQYDVLLDGEYVGMVTRTGQLASSYKWLVDLASDQNVRIISQRTLDAAVALVVAHAHLIDTGAER